MKDYQRLEFSASLNMVKLKVIATGGIKKENELLKKLQPWTKVKSNIIKVHKRLEVNGSLNVLDSIKVLVIETAKKSY